MAKILVIAEQQGGQLKKATLAAITLARQIGQKVGGVADALQGYGAEAIHVADAPVFANYLAQPFTTAIKAAAAGSGADFVIAPATTFGKDVLPQLGVEPMPPVVPAPGRRRAADAARPEVSV